MQDSKRIEWLDILKGFAIILVIFGHALKDSYIKTWIYCFHLGIFYFVSGYTFRPERYGSFPRFLARKARTVLLPYLFYSGLSILFMMAWNLFKGDALNAVLTEGADSLIGTVVMMRGTRFEGECWFLPMLFIADAVYFLIARLARLREWMAHALVIGLFFLGAMYQNAVGRPLPLYLDTVPLALILIHGGSIVARKKLLRRSAAALAISGALAFLIAFALYRTGFRIDLYENSIGNPLLYLLSNAAGICFFTQIAMMIGEHRALSRIGRNSLRFYALHRPVVFYPLRYGLNVLFGIFWVQESRARELAYAVVLSAATVLLLYGLAVLLERKRARSA